MSGAAKKPLRTEDCQDTVNPDGSTKVSDTINNWIDVIKVVPAGDQIELRVGVSILTNRKLTIIEAKGKGITFGSNVAAGAKSFNAFKNQLLAFPIAPSDIVYIHNSTASPVNVAIMEGSTI